MTNNPIGRESAAEYATLEEALGNWVPMKDRQEVWPEIQKIAEKLIANLGDPLRIHIPLNQPYIALTFTKEPKRIGAYINVGHVDHIVEIEGSHVPEAAPSYWRTLMTTSHSSSTKGAENAPDKVVCPNCFLRISPYATCDCGWVPADN